MIEVNFTDDQLLEEIRKVDPVNNPNYDQADDIAAAALFADLFRSVCRYNTDRRAWMIYNGSFWQKESSEAAVEVFIMRYVRQLQYYAIGLNTKERTTFQKYIQELGDRRPRERMARDIKGRMSVKQSDFDCMKNYFNCLNGVLDLDEVQPNKKLVPLPHSFDQYLTKQAATLYDPKEKAPRFMQFLDEIMSGDREKIKYLQQIFGLALLDGNPEEEIYLLLGRSGRNGKSVLLNVMGELFGGSNPESYSAVMMPETLAKRNREANAASGDLARLRAIRLLISSEPPKGMLFNTALLKNLTGRDKITARGLYEKEFEFQPGFSLFMACNSLPIINDEIVFRSGRVNVIEFNRTFEGSAQDKNLRSKLCAEFPGILNWCLEGLRIYRKNGERISVPEAVRLETRSYQKQCDKIQEFLDDCTKSDPDQNERLSDFYEVYSAWSKKNGYTTESKRTVKELLINRGMFISKKWFNGNTWLNVVPGIEITFEAKKSYLKNF